MTAERTEKNNDPIVADLTSLQSEFAQLSELDEMEHNYAIKLVESLKVLQSGIDTALPLHVASLGERFSQAKQAYLASDAVVLVMREDGRTQSIPLSRLEPKTVLAVVQDSTPELGKIISERRKAVGSRVDLLERILKELKKASSMIKQTQRDMSTNVEEDLVQNSITSD